MPGGIPALRTWPWSSRSRIVDKTAVQGAINARAATAGMAANEVSARVADDMSCDLLDFIEATGRDCSLSTTSVNRRGPPSMPRADLGITPARKKRIDRGRES